MTFYSFAIRNLSRHKIRTVLTITAVAIACGVLFSIFSFDVGYKQSLQEEIARTGIHLFVSTEGCPLEAASLIIHGGEIPRFLKMDILKDVKRVKGVKAAAGFLIFSLPTPDKNKVDLFYGVTDDVLKLKPNWKIKGNWFNDENSIILGSEVARIEKRNIGDKIFIESIGKEFKVTGILERTFGQDDGFYFLPIQVAQKYFKKEGKLTAIGVQLEDINKLEEVKSELEDLSDDVYVVPAEDINKRILDLIAGTKALMYSILIVTLVVCAIGLFNTILMATYERQKEFGFMRCIGAKPIDVIKLITIETLIISSFGTIVGLVLSIIFSTIVEYWIRQFLPYVPAGKLLRPNLIIACFSVITIFSVGILACLYPAYKASKVSPLEAIRNE